MKERSNGAAAMAAAAFVVEALGLAEQPGELSEDLLLVADAATATTFAVELDSADGPVAFLVYVYDLGLAGESGVTGRDLFDSAMATLSEAERLDAPGPRMVASGEVGPYGLLLATTPMVFDRLGGNRGGRTEDAQVGVAGRREVGEAAAIAEALIKALRETNRLAEAYLQTGGGPRLGATPQESELGLYLADGRSLAPLLTLVRRVVQGVEAGQ